MADSWGKSLSCIVIIAAIVICVNAKTTVSDLSAETTTFIDSPSRIDNLEGSNDDVNTTDIPRRKIPMMPSTTTLKTKPSATTVKTKPSTTTTIKTTPSPTTTKTIPSTTIKTKPSTTTIIKTTPSPSTTTPMTTTKRPSTTMFTTTIDTEATSKTMPVIDKWTIQLIVMIVVVYMALVATLLIFRLCAKRILQRNSKTIHKDDEEKGGSQDNKEQATLEPKAIEMEDKTGEDIKLSNEASNPKTDERTEDEDQQETDTDNQTNTDEEGSSRNEEETKNGGKESVSTEDKLVSNEVPVNVANDDVVNKNDGGTNENKEKPIVTDLEKSILHDLNVFQESVDDFLKSTTNEEMAKTEENTGEKNLTNENVPLEANVIVNTVNEAEKLDVKVTENKEQKENEEDNTIDSKPTINQDIVSEGKESTAPEDRTSENVASGDEEQSIQRASECFPPPPSPFSGTDDGNMFPTTEDTVEL